MVGEDILLDVLYKKDNDDVHRKNRVSPTEFAESDSLSMDVNNATDTVNQIDTGVTWEDSKLTTFSSQLNIFSLKISQ